MSTLASTPPQCDAKALDWALFILTIISTSVTWWLFSLPTLFTRCLAAYIHDVSWESHRLLIPSLVAFKAVLQERPNWQMTYYAGVAKPATRFHDVKAFMQDSFIVVSTALALYRLCKGGKANKDLSGLNASLWSYPSLPVAILGLAIFVFSRTHVKKWIIYVLTLLIIAAIGASIAVVSGLTYGNGVFIPSLILLIYMALPVWIISERWIFLVIIFASGMRISGPVIGAISKGAYFPFCALKGWKFAGPVLAFGILNCVLAVNAGRLEPRVEATTDPTDEEQVVEVELNQSRIM